MRFDQTKLLRGLLLLAAISLSSCGGGGGGSSSTPPPVVIPTVYYSIGGTFTTGGAPSGILPAAGLVLHNNRGNASAINAGDTSFSFTTQIASGAAYDVTVFTQPTGQFCTVTNGTGTASASIPAITVKCVAARTISVTVSGLGGTGLVLQNRNSVGTTVVDNLPISIDGTFPFNTRLVDGDTHTVSMLSRPRSPPQDCVIAGGTGGNGSGNVAGDVTVTITCANSPGGILLDKPRYAYVANSNDHTVSSYIVNATTGQLRPNGYAYVGTNTGPSSVAVDPSGQFAYVANSLGDSVSAYAIGAGGRLTSVAAAIPAGDGPSSVTVDPSGRYVYVTNAIGENITAYSINLGTGALTRVPCIGGVALGCSGNNVLNYLVGANPTSITVAPAGQYAYVANSSGVSAYSIDSYGALTAADTDATAGVQTSITAGSNPNSISISPSGAYAYVANNGNGVSGYSINPSGALTAVAGNPFTAGTNPRSVAIDPYGLSVYVANFTSSSVSAFDIIGAGVISSLGADVGSSGTGPTSVIVDPSGTFAYMVNNTTADVSAYNITGGLPVPLSGAAGTMRSRAGSASIAMTKGAAAVAYTPTFAYVANDGGDVSAYTINANTGALTPVAGNPFTAGTNPSSVTVHPSGQFAYVANNGSANISIYDIDSLTVLGALVPNGSIGTGSGPSAVTVDPSGRFAYVTNSDATVWGYSIDVAVGDLIQIDMNGVTAGMQNIDLPGSNPRSVTIDPTGRFAYVAHDSGVTAYYINPSSGALSFVGTVGAGVTPSSVTVDPTGKFAYVVNNGGTTVSAYSINASTGELSSETTIPTGTNPKAIAIDPTGKFAYVANNGANSVSGYSIDPATGVLASIDTDAVSGGNEPTILAGTGPMSVTIDISGSYVYVANSGGDVWAYSINTTTGALTSLGAPTAAGTTPAAITTTGTIQ